MAKLNFVRRARKAIPQAGIEVGDSYYFYKRRVNGKGTPRVCSKRKPRRSAYATSSPFMGALMDMEDSASDLVAMGASPEEVAGWLDNASQEVSALGEDCREKAGNVEAGMKNGSGATSAGILLARADHCSDLAAAMREAANELLLGGDDLSENEGEDVQESGVSIASVLGALVWLPQ